MASNWTYKLRNYTYLLCSLCLSPTKREYCDSIWWWCTDPESQTHFVFLWLYIIKRVFAFEKREYSYNSCYGAYSTLLLRGLHFRWRPLPFYIQFPIFQKSSLIFLLLLKSHLCFDWLRFHPFLHDGLYQNTLHTTFEDHHLHFNQFVKCHPPCL